MLLMIDNYDSFTHNVVQYLKQLGQSVKVVRNDALTVNDIGNLRPTHIVISPGPGSPSAAGVSVATIQHWAREIPILGVCLGHQSIGYAFGGNVVAAKTLMHGKTSTISHRGEGVFKGVPNGFCATRYHSLAVERSTLPDCLEITAWADDGEIMGIRHKQFATQGVQFHPEAILTEYGLHLLENFLNSTSSNIGL